LKQVIQTLPEGGDMPPRGDMSLLRTVSLDMKGGYPGGRGVSLWPENVTGKKKHTRLGKFEHRRAIKEPKEITRRNSNTIRGTAPRGKKRPRSSEKSF